MHIQHEPEAHRFVLLEGDIFQGEVEYQEQGDTLLLVRAEVPEELRGNGLGVPLVRGTLEAIKEQGGWKVTPICPYIAKYMMKNREFDDLRA